MRIANIDFATLSGDDTRDRGVISLGGPGEKFHFAPHSNKSFCTMPATKCSSGGAPLTAASGRLCVMPPSNVILVGVLGDTTTLSERSCKIDWHHWPGFKNQLMLMCAVGPAKSLITSFLGTSFFVWIKGCVTFHETTYPIT